MTCSVTTSEVTTNSRIEMRILLLLLLLLLLCIKQKEGMHSFEIIGNNKTHDNIKNN